VAKLQLGDQVNRDGDLGPDRRAYQRRSAVAFCREGQIECLRIGDRVALIASVLMAPMPTSVDSTGSTRFVGRRSSSPRESDLTLARIS
jgi:hypothetical protein